MMQATNKATAGIFNFTVLVAALGYFVDIYDLLLFQIVRVDSLKDMGLDAPLVKSEGNSSSAYKWPDSW